jgi:hypothetical protein
MRGATSRCCAERSGADRRGPRSAVAVGVGAALALVPTGAHAAPLTVGFGDAFLGAVGADRWIARMPAAGASEIRIGVSWASIAPDAPPDPASAADARWRGYRFDGLDARLRTATAAGLRPLLTIDGAPAWAEGPGRPETIAPGAWRPDPDALARFATAVARRYDGTVADPARPGAPLPRVDAFQIWNEPNLRRYLAPQVARSGTAAPELYRRMLVAASDAIHAVRPGATVVTAGASPFGDDVPTTRMRPLAFWRRVLCLDAALRRTCRTAVRVDVLAHHPYPTLGPPGAVARHRDDVTIGDLRKLGTLVRAARRAGTLAGPRPALWVTELGVRSRPPATGPSARSLGEQARYLAESLRRLSAQGARRVYLFSIVDLPPLTGSSILSGLGVFRADGRAKPAALAVSFTVAAQRRGRRLEVWARPPVAGTLTLEVRRGAAWRAVATASAAPGRTVVRRIPVSGARAVRARVGDRVSYAWRVR